MITNNIFKICMTLLLFCNYTEPSLITLTPENHVSVQGEITDELITHKILELAKLNSDIIYVYIQSNGGSVLAGKRFIQFISTLNNHGKNISCIADEAFSMGFVILQYCPHRYVMQNSIIMQHQMSLGVSGPINNMDNYLTMIHQIKEELNNHQANRLKLSLEIFEQQISNDLWIYGENIIKSNAADEIVEVLCSKELITGKKKVKLETFFGNLKLDYSLCPVLNAPINTKVVSNYL